MKRKVKFQEGGAVESPRNRQLRETMERFGREGRRVGLAERARQREAANQAARRQRAADMREVERMNPGQGAAEVERRAGRAVPERRPDFTTDPRGTTRPGADTGREMVRSSGPQVPATRSVGGDVGPTRPTMQQAMTNVTRPQIPLGRVRPSVGGGVAGVAGAAAAEALGPLVDYGREYAARRGEEADARRELNLLSMRARTADAEGGDMAADAERQRQEAMRPAPRPTPAPAPRPAAPARRPAPARREMSADRLNDLAMGAEPANAEERVAQMRMQQRRRELEGGAFKKGGMVKAKAAPKKMMKGGMVAKPKVAASKAKPKAMPKAMPFKKGGMIKKGKK